MKKLCLAYLVAVACAASLAAAETRDLVVIGGTEGAVAFAVAEKAKGRDVLLLAPRGYLGEDRAGSLVCAADAQTPLAAKKRLDERLQEARVDFRTWAPVSSVRQDGVTVSTRSRSYDVAAREVRDFRIWRVDPSASREGRTLRATRIVVSGERPAIEGGSIEKIADFGLVVIDRCAPGFANVVTAIVWRCTFEVPLAENTVRGRLAVEQAVRDLTWTPYQLDAADVTVTDADTALAPCGTIDCDVLVVGAGTAGAPAAISAARAGARTVVCEWTYRCGGLTTDGMIGDYWYGNVCGFTSEIDEGHRKLGANFNQTKDEWFRREARRAGAEILCGTLVTDVIKDGDRIVGAHAILPTGERVRINCRVLVDATGNADLAASAGEPTEFVSADELALQGAAFTLKQLGRSYMNADFSFIDDTDAEDLFYVSLRGRTSAGLDYWDQSQVVDTRERRRLHGVCYVTPQDVMNGRTYPDTICITRSNFDTHGETIDPQFFIVDPPHHPPLSVNLPYRAFLPRRTEGLLVVGLGMSAHRDAMPILRMQPDVQNQGYAAGLAAAMSVRAGVPPRQIDVKALQRKLVEKGVVPESVLTMTDSYPIHDSALDAAVKSLANGYRGLSQVMAEPSRALPRLRSAFATATGDRKVVLAHVLAMMGDGTGGRVLAEKLSEMDWDEGWNYRGMHQFRRSVSWVDSYVIALGRARVEGGDTCIRRMADRLTPSSEYSHFRAVALALESFGGEENAACLGRLLSLPGVAGHAFDFKRDGAPAIRKWDVYPVDLKKDGPAIPDRERSDCLRELAVARALYRCGDDMGRGRAVLEAYAADPRKAYANHAKKVLSSAALGKEFLGGLPETVLLDGKPGADAVTVEADGRVVLSGVESASTVVLRWRRNFPADAKFLGGMWERTYGDSGWRRRDEGFPRQGSMPWYFLVRHDGVTDGYGVKVQPNAFASWKVTPDGVELLLDVRAGSDPVRLNGRRLELCTLVFRKGVPGESAYSAGRAFCRLMCPQPRLPREQVYGYNDWYCAYGRNTATNFLSDAGFVVSLLDRGGKVANRPFVVVDDGWQLKEARGDAVPDEGQWVRSNDRWGMEMDEFCRRVKALDARPGLWYRPLMPWKGMPDALKTRGIATNIWNGGDFSVDPTSPELDERIRRDLRRFAGWGIELVKIDFITYDWNARWGFDLGERVIDHDGCHWRDRSRTTAEVVRGLYATLRDAAGDGMYIIGCNAIDHFAAGLFELQRTGDDTSGRDWERTCRMGPNTLGMRAMQNGTFYLGDGDCVGLVREGLVPWEKNRQWLDLVAKSGTSLFLSWKRSLAADPEVASALSKALKTASCRRRTGEPLDWMERERPRRWRFDGESDITYDAWD